MNRSRLNLASFLLQKLIKNISQRVKKGIRDFSLNSVRGDKTPSWRKMGSKKCHTFFGTNKFVL